MLAALIGIDRLRERNVGRVVAGNDALRVFLGDVRLQWRQFLIARALPAIVERFARDIFKSTLGIDAGAASLARVGVLSGKRLQRHCGITVDSTHVIRAIESENSRLLRARD